MSAACAACRGLLRSMVPVLLLALTAGVAPAGVPEVDEVIVFDGQWSQEWALQPGEALELSVQLTSPSALPPNARIAVEWEAPDAAEPAFEGDRGDSGVAATASWSKILHALDPDMHVVYRAIRPGFHVLRLKTVVRSPQPVGEIPHDTGLAPQATPLPADTPPVDRAEISIALRPVPSLAAPGIVLEAEPNNAPEQATDITFANREGDQVVSVIGGADDVEYYNNTRLGSLPDDWYRIEYKGADPKFLSANLQLIEPVVSARIRFYKEGVPSDAELQERDMPDSRDFANFNPIPYVHPPADVIPGPVPVYTYEEGRAINERAHQQDRSFRTFVTRKLEPGQTYYLRIEANQPHYELQVRLFDPAPYDDPRRAVQQAVYYHLAEIDAWLIHRPRNIAPHRRVRDASNLFGENCMSCHTQSGVWGVADALAAGYGTEGVEQNYRRLVNTMYESLRLTNDLRDAAVNTSVAPNDLGDGPAGTRVAGRNIVLHERANAPKKLHAQWQRRTANYVLQTAEPKGINAAGRGSNFGPNVVFKFSGEVLERAWRSTSDPRYFFGLEERGRKILATGDDIRVTDDYGHRVEFFYRTWPSDYVAQVERLTSSPERVAAARELQRDFEERVKADIDILLALQRDDGGWGFDPGRAGEDGQWVRPDDHSYPAATSVALLALEAAGWSADDPVVARGVQWMLGSQYPYGLWNAAAATGFVTTAYAIRALSRLHPNQAKPESADLRLDGQESFLEALGTARQAQASGDSRYFDLFLKAASHPRPQVRLYGLLGLGTSLAAQGVPTLIEHLDDPVKSCREAAFWSLRQLLLDGAGWDLIEPTYRNGSDRARQSLLQALVTRAHLPGSGVDADLGEISAILTAAMVDPHPGVRAYAFKAAWHWWVWNPPVREAIQRAWIDALLRPEDEAHVDMALRYSTISLFVVNGQVNNITGGKYLEQQYPELAKLFAELAEARKTVSDERRVFLDRRLAALAASHYMERANQQSPGQFAYSTPGSTELFGKAVHAVYKGESDGAVPWQSIALEGARNIAYKPLQDRMLALLRGADTDTAAVAARALSNPSELSLAARAEILRPLLAMLRAYAREGREKDSDAVASFLSRVKWDFDGGPAEAETAFYRLLLGSAPESDGGQSPAGAESYVPLIARILGQNLTLHRKEAFRHLSGTPRLWLDSTEWMLAFDEGATPIEEAVEGAVEAEDLEVAELTFGRTTEQMITDGLASGNSVLIWEEGKLGAHLSFALGVPADGVYDLLGAFLYGASHGIVEISLDGRPVLAQTDFYRPEVSSTGPMSLGSFELRKGRSVLTVRMVGTNPEAEPELKFGLDYVKLAAREEDGSVRAAGSGATDPMAAAKASIVEMFVRAFSPEAATETRDLASRLSGRPALRRNPAVRKAIAAYVEDEPVASIRSRLKNLLANDDRSFRADLRKLINAGSGTADSRARPLSSSADFIEDILHFRDHAFAEMTKISDRDNRACLSCHAVPGRVPTLYLRPPDSAGYIAAADLLANYRELQARVDIADPGRSLLLRKPLNVQTGQEEGHQGGQRYEAEDAGFLVLKEWVLRQTELQSASQ